MVVSGKARVHHGDEVHDLGINEPTYHGKETVHTLENPDATYLELIEAQVGSYLE